MQPAPKPVRRYIQPTPGEDWQALLQRLSSRGDAQGAGQSETTPSLEQLLGWNLHLAYRPPSNPLTPLDIVFIEGPR